jgi:hypothetical protein
MVANFLSFVVGQTGKRRALPRDSDLFDKVDEIFAIEIKFFGERVNACGHVVEILSIRLESKPAFLIVDQ